MSEQPVFARQDVPVAVMQGRGLMDVLDVIRFLESASGVLSRDPCTAVAGEVFRLEKEALIKKARMAGDQRF